MIFHSQYDGKVIIQSCSSHHQPGIQVATNWSLPWCLILRVESYVLNDQTLRFPIIKSWSSKVYPGVPPSCPPWKTRICPSNVTEKPFNSQVWGVQIVAVRSLLVKYRVFLTYSTTSLAQRPIFLIQVRHHFSSSKPNVSWYFLSCCCLQNPHSFALTTSLCLLVVDYRDNYPQNANVHHFLWLNNVI